MKLLLFGANGQIGWELRRALAPVGELLALTRNMEGGDLGCISEVARVLRQFRPNVIVNAAAYTNVDSAESESEVAHQINARAPAALAKLACETGAWLVHYSTDYVFDGTGRTPWREGDATAAINVYGASKFEGEEAIKASGCLYLIFRTSWVFGIRGRNFPKTILRLAAEREIIQIVNDQFGSPTGAELIADATAHAIREAIQRPGVSGLYHLTASGETSWYDYAYFILEMARRRGAGDSLTPLAILPVPTADYPTPATRPLNSRLDTHRFTQTFNLRLPPWETGVANFLTEILDHSS
ncbi:MAG: dTDP-4-dehydrorhamnose reductase [Oleiphilaceae bacterium]|nr:dTDP-4-dehydrorhamnose reductase [Oleiphilaceae bacterium]